ncbi:phospholipid/cholesterol/gamma-HCH transport system substrate-binding protein [Desulfovibrionales bacterium]
MSMAHKRKHFILGAFVLSGFTLLVISIVTLGTGIFFERTIPAETYFNESVQGLDVGAPVKYRGVKIGMVSRIGFVLSKYAIGDDDNLGGRYVLVEMQLNAKLISKLFPSEQPDIILEEVTRSGLRARLTAQGLTGTAFLQIDFVDPRLNPPLPVAWTPISLYFPSAPSALSQLEDALSAVGSFVRQLDTLDVKVFITTLDSFFKQLSISLREADVEHIGQLVIQNLDESRKALKRFNELAANPKADTILTDFSDTAAGTRRIVQSSEKNVVGAMQRFKTAMDNLDKTLESVKTLLVNPWLQTAAEGLPVTLAAMRNATQDTRRGAAQLERLLRTLNEMVISRRSDIETIIARSKALVDNLNDLTDEAKYNPSRLLFGAPPQKIHPERLP